MRFLMCDSEVVTLLTVRVIIRRGKGQGSTILNIHPLLPLAFIFWCKKKCAHPCCAKSGFWQRKQHERAETAAGPCRTGQGGIGLCMGSAFLGESLVWLQCWTGLAVVERRQISSSKARPSIAGAREERMGSRRGWVPERRVCQKDVAGSGAAGLCC